MPYEQAYFVVIGTFSLIAKARGRHLRHRIVYYDTYAIFILNPNLQFILPYDLPPLAFEQICCLLVLRRRWAVLGVVFALATLNGETDFLIILFLAARAWTGSEDRRTGLVVAAILSGIWWAIKLTLLALVAVVGSDAPIGRITNFQPVYNFTTMLKPWQWPALSMLFIPVILTIWFLFEKPSKKALDWILPYIIGFSMIFLVAQVTEHRSYGYLREFAAMSLMFFLKSRDVLFPSGVAS